MDLEVEVGLVDDSDVVVSAMLTIGGCPCSPGEWTLKPHMVQNVGLQRHGSVIVSVDETIPLANNWTHLLAHRTTLKTIC